MFINELFPEALFESRIDKFGGLTFKISQLDSAESEHSGFILTALDPTWGRELGYVVFADLGNNELDPRDLYVDERYQGQGIAKTMYDYAQSLGYTIHRSPNQTDAGRGFWDKHRGDNVCIWETELTEISDELRQNYLDRAMRQVNRRMEKMAKVRDRLNKRYEIFYADSPYDPNAVVHEFCADTPQDAVRYFNDYEVRYDSDVDYELKLRRATGISVAETKLNETSRIPRDIEEFIDELSPNDTGVEEFGRYRVHYEGFSDECQSSSDYRRDPEAVYQQVFDDFIAREGGLKPLVQDMAGDEDYPILYSIFKIPKQLKEISRIPQNDLGDWGGKDTFAPMTKLPKDRKPLPGGSKFTYAINRNGNKGMEIMIFDGDALVAELDLFATMGALKSWGVETVITDPDYRGQGLAKSLYGIALSILKLTLEAGDTQTKNGQAMWLMLNSIPGVEVLGYAMAPPERYRPHPGDKVVSKDKNWIRYTFPIEAGKRSMRSTRPGLGIYSSQHVTMIAKWTGQ